jgi:hypothetical protein
MSILIDAGLNPYNPDCLCTERMHSSREMTVRCPACGRIISLNFRDEVLDLWYANARTVKVEWVSLIT